MLKREMKFIAQLALIFTLLTLGIYNVIGAGIGDPGIQASPPVTISNVTGGTNHNAATYSATGLSTGIAPGANGNVLTSNGTDWTSAAATGGSSAANPTGVITGAAVNGVAATYLRSDGAPAIGAAITTADALADVKWSPTATTQKALVLQGKAAQTASVFEIQGGNGTSFFALDASPVTFTGTNATIAGKGAMIAATSADDTVAIGVNALKGVTTGDRNTAFGKDAGSAAGGAAMSDCLFGGYQSGLLNTGTQNTFLGSSSGAANTSSTGQCFIGYQSGLITTGANNTLVGSGVCSTGLTTGTQNVIVGAAAFGGTSTDSCVILGYNASASAGVSGSVALGATTTSTASNQFVVGNSSFASTNWFGGNGVTHTAATAYTINGTGGSGANNAGGGITIGGGKGTGTAKGGNVLVQTTPSAASSSTLQTLTDRVIVVAQGKTLSSGVATTVATWTLTNGTSGGGRIVATIQCTDATDFQNFTQTIELSLVNKAGTYTSNIVASTGAKAVSAGTLTTAWTVTAAGAVQVNATTSLTPSGTNGFVIYYTIENNSQSNVTLP